MPGPRALLALLVAALALHAAVLAALDSAWREPEVLRPIVAPLLTRQLAATPAPAPPPAATAVPRAPVFKPNRPQVHVPSTQDATETVAISTNPEPPPAPTETEVAPEVAAAPPAPAPDPAPGPAPTPAAATETAAVPPPAPAWPADTQLSYRLGGNFRGELTGDARVLWQREGGRYQVRVELDIGWFVSMVMTSQGSVTPSGLAPSVYVETLRNRRRTALMGGERVTLDDGTRVPQPGGVQDTASQFVELAWRFQNGLEKLESGRSVTFWMARPGGVDRLTYEIVGEDTLYLPRLGAVQAFHLKPRPIANPRGTINAEIWFAPALQYLPVRIRITLGANRNAEQFVDLVVDKIEQR